jgi:hypothetical protein
VNFTCRCNTCFSLAGKESWDCKNGMWHIPTKLKRRLLASSYQQFLLESQKCAHFSSIKTQKSSIKGNCRRRLKKIINSTISIKKLICRRYASLYFCCAIEQDDNELLTLEIIHRYVELLDKYFGSVSAILQITSSLSRIL